MIDSKKLYDLFLTSSRIILSFLILQFLNVVLFFVGMGIIFLPLLFLIDTICIKKIIFQEEFFSFKFYFQTIKQNIVKSLGILGIITILFLGINANMSMINYIMVNNFNLLYYLITLIGLVLLFFALISIIIYAPLVNATDKISTLKLVKVSLLMPFAKLKITCFLILMCICSFIIITNNLLFFLLIGPNLLITCNLVIYLYYLREDH
ncbi:MAG: hypothetical protein ACK5HR_03525 [Mycoplasmatales bacterium]